MSSLNILTFLLFTLNYKGHTASRTNFHIKSVSLCNSTQGLVKFMGNITEEKGKYYLTSRIITPIQLDTNIGNTLKIETLYLNTYVELFTIREKYFCKAANIYGGEFWYNIERHVGLLPKACPIPAGRYEAHHVEMDFNDISLQTFPFGYIKLTFNLVDNKRPQIYLMCFTMQIYNVPEE